MYSTLSSHVSVDDTTTEDTRANELLPEDTLTKPSGQFSRATFRSIRFVECLPRWNASQNTTQLVERTAPHKHLLYIEFPQLAVAVQQQDYPEIDEQFNRNNDHP